MLVYARCIAILLGVLSAAVYSSTTQVQGAPAQSAATALDPGMDMSQVIALLQQQQQDLAEQRKLLEAQANQIASLKNELDVLRTPTPLVSVADKPASTEPPAQVGSKVVT